MALQTFLIPRNKRKAVACLYPFKPEGTSNSYQLDQSTIVLRVVGCCCLLTSFSFAFYQTFCKQTVEALITGGKPRNYHEIVLT